MSPRKWNMLEAFQVSERSRTARDRPADPAVPSAKGPAPDERAAAPSASTSSGSSGRSAEHPLFADRGARAPLPPLAALIALALLAGAFWLGRWSVRNEVAAMGAGRAPSPEAGDPAAAGESTPPAAPGGARAPEGAPGQPAEPAQEPPAESYTADDLAFKDRQNRFTVRAIYYADTPEGWKRALSTYRYLRECGLPAVAPIAVGTELYLCVGAGPTLDPSKDDRLAKIRQTLKALPGPPPQSEPGAFSGAFFQNIDDLVERE